MDVKPIISEVDWCHEPMDQSRECVGADEQLSPRTRVYDTRKHHSIQRNTYTSWRSDVPIILLVWSVTRVGPGQYPQYTCAPEKEEAVGSSPTAQKSQGADVPPTAPG